MKKRKVVRARRVLKHIRKTHKVYKTTKKVSKKITKIKSVFAPVSTLAFNKRHRKPRKPRTPSNKMYFTQETENAVIEYNNETNQDKRNTIYNTRIRYPFEKLVENVFNTFKFSYFDYSIDNVIKDTVSYMTKVMHNFNPLKDSKKHAGKKTSAYSYFSIVCKNYLIQTNNKQYNDWKKFVPLEETLLDASNE